jgi:hypothetical protein
VTGKPPPDTSWLRTPEVLERERASCPPDERPTDVIPRLPDDLRTRARSLESPYVPEWLGGGPTREMSVIQPPTPAPVPTPAPGPLETSVRRDIEALGPLTSGVRSTMAEMAYGLARQLDRAILADAEPTAVATLNRELRVTLTQVVNTADDNTRRDQLTEILGTAVQTAEVPADLGNAPQPQPADDGAETGAGRPDAGRTVHAAPAAHVGCDSGG